MTDGPRPPPEAPRPDGPASGHADCDRRLGLRALLSFLALPGTVIVLVPTLLARYGPVGWRAPVGPADWTLLLVALPLLAVGLTLLVACVLRFARRGRGTLAPWDPPRKLLVDGPWAHVRHPMISGVVLTLFGQAAALRSWPHALWAATFLTANLVWIPRREEPDLERRFGDEYRRYRRNVPRLIPRRRPWRPDQTS